MDIERVAPQLRGRLRWAKPIGIERALGRRAIAGLMAVMPGAKVEGVTVEDRPDLARGLRVYRPATRRSDGALLFVHGGGLVIGRPIVNDRMCAEIAREVGIVVVSPEYRKAPEHPYPAALDDVHQAWAALLRDAPSLGVDRARIVVGGESAGGGIAAALAQRLHDEGGIQPAGQLLFCPMLDDRTAARRDLDVVDHFVWNNARNRFGWRSYLGHEPGTARPPDYAVPARRDDCSGTPAGLDRLRRDRAVPRRGRRVRGPPPGRRGRGGGGRRRGRAARLRGLGAGHRPRPRARRASARVAAGTGVVSVVVSIARRERDPRRPSAVPRSTLPVAEGPLAAS